MVRSVRRRPNAVVTTCTAAVRTGASWGERLSMTADYSTRTAFVDACGNSSLAGKTGAYGSGAKITFTGQEQ